jgi:ABC-type uncharacterized transport system permease subunit
VAAIEAKKITYGFMGLVVGVAVSLGLAAIVGIYTELGPKGLAAAIVEGLIDARSWRAALPYFIPIAASAIGLAVSYRAAFITIGAEGQVILGAASAFWLLYYVFDGQGASLAVSLALVFAGLVGMAYSLIVAALRVFVGVNEILSSLMLNYVAIGIVNYLVAGPWQQGGYTRTAVLPESQSISLGIGVTLVLFIGILLEFFIIYTKYGVAIDAVRYARRAAQTYGVSISSTILLVSAIQGFAAGVGGAAMLLVVLRQLRSIGLQGWGYGYMGILAAWLGGLHPIGALAASMLISILYSLRSMLQLYGISDSLVLALEAILVLSMLAFTTLALRQGGGVKHGKY